MPLHLGIITSLFFVLHVISVVSAILAPAVQAQPRTMNIDHPHQLPMTGFASDFAVLGDVDGDRTPDYAIGAYQHRWKDNDRQGRVFVHSGRTGSLLYTIDNPSPQPDGAFGYAVAALGDVNADGVPDLLVGAFGQGEAGSALSLTQGEQEGRIQAGPELKKVGSGQAFVFSGENGQLLYAMEAPHQHAGAQFGFATAVLGDLSNDGIPDLLIGAPAQGGTGRAFIFSGHDGTLLSTLSPPAPPGRDAFGWSVTGTSDLNTDGTPDLLVGAPYTNVNGNSVQGRVYAFSGRDQSLLYQIESPKPLAGSVFGWHLSAGGDVNADGVADTLVGAPYTDVQSIPSQGEAYAFSGVDGRLLRSLHNPALQNAYAGFGYRVAWTMDMNEDGAAEILISAPHQSVGEFRIQGAVFVFNGLDGRHLMTFDNPEPHQGSKFGYAIASLGDLHDDGIPEFAISASGQTIGQSDSAGRIYVFQSQ